MGDDKRSVEDKRFAILSRDSIKTYAESVGHSDISDEVASLLSEDVVYRVREATMNAFQFMRHSKRRKLTTEDFNKGLKNSDVQPLLGFSQPAKLPFRHTRESDLFFVEESEVELAPAALKPPTVSQPGTTTVNAQWLAVEGIQKGAVLGSATVAKPTGKVSDDLLAYYDNMTKAILGNDEQVMKHAFADLRKNSKIAPLLPYFVNFVNNGVKTVSHDISQLIKLLHTVKALVCNQALYLEPKPYLDLLVQTVLYCLLEPLAASINPLNDHWAVRDYAARLLAHMTSVWTTTVNQLRRHNMSALQEVLYDLGRPFCSHYGAVMGLIAFGTKAVERVLLPHLTRYWVHLQTVMDDPTCTSSDPRKVYGAILLAMERVVNERAAQLLNPTPQTVDELDDPNDSLSGLVDFSMYTMPTAVTPAIPVVKSAASAASTTAAAAAGGTAVSAGTADPGEPATSTPLKPGIHFPHRDLLGPVIELPDMKDASSLAQPMEQDSELIGTVLNLPETNGLPATEHLSLSALYLQLAEYFGDSLAARLPVWRVSDLYVQNQPEPVVSLADPDSRKTGEELLQVFLNHSTTGSKLDDSENVDMKSENQSYEPTPDDNEIDETDDKSERSSDHSDDSTFIESNLTVKTVVSDSGAGIKLTFRMAPKIEPPAPLPVVPPPPPPEPEPVPQPVKKERRKYLDEEVFEREPFEPPHLHTTFVFSYAGCVQESQPKPRKERTIFDDSHLQWSGRLLEINTKQYGRRKGCSVQDASRRRHDHTCSLYNNL